MEAPNPEIVRVSAVSYLHQCGSDEEAQLLNRCKLELGKSAQRYAGTTQVGLNFTLRCAARDLELFSEHDFGVAIPSDIHRVINDAVAAVLPAEFSIHSLAARSVLIDRAEFDKGELVRLIDAQKDLMIAVATGGPRIQQKNSEYASRRTAIQKLLAAAGHPEPNPFSDLWSWYGRWSSGDLASYQSRRAFVQQLYEPLLESLAGLSRPSASDPEGELTGWTKVDRLISQIVVAVRNSTREEDFQTIGLLCRECLIALAQQVYDAALHQPSDGTRPSSTDAARMLDGYFGCQFSGASHEALRRHAKASLVLANHLQHRPTAAYREAALCAEATRTVVNIVAITCDRR